MATRQRTPLHHLLVSLLVLLGLIAAALPASMVGPRPVAADDTAIESPTPAPTETATDVPAPTATSTPDPSATPSPTSFPTPTKPLPPSRPPATDGG